MEDEEVERKMVVQRCHILENRFLYILNEKNAHGFPEFSDREIVSVMLYFIKEITDRQIDPQGSMSQIVNSMLNQYLKGS